MPGHRKPVGLNKGAYSGGVILTGVNPEGEDRRTGGVEMPRFKGARPRKGPRLTRDQRRRRFDRLAGCFLLHLLQRGGYGGPSGMP